MRTEYPEYKRGELDKVFLALNPKDKQTIEEFISYCGIGAGKNKLSDIKRSIIQFRDIIQKPFDKIELKDLRDFLGILNKSNREKYTQNGIKVHIKKFLRWKFKDWSARFDELKDIRQVKAFNEEKINSNTLLKKEDIEKIMKAENSIFWKAFFITLYESGLRPIELRNLKWKNINFNVDGDISELNIFATKTSKARAVYVKEATFYLLKLKEETISELCFPSPRDKNRPVVKSALANWLHKISKKAIGREIYPYILRHSRATELYKNMPSKVAEKFMGHGTDMSDLYTHLNNDDVKEAMGKIVYKLEELPPEKKTELEKQVKILKQLLVQLQQKVEDQDRRFDLAFKKYIKKD
jgi:integrase